MKICVQSSYIEFTGATSKVRRNYPQLSWAAGFILSSSWSNDFRVKSSSSFSIAAKVSHANHHHHQGRRWSGKTQGRTTEKPPTLQLNISSKHPSSWKSSHTCQSPIFMIFSSSLLSLLPYLDFIFHAFVNVNASLVIPYLFHAQPVLHKVLWRVAYEAGVKTSPGMSWANKEKLNTQWQQQQVLL